MPLISTGNPFNAAAFLRMFGEAVTLPDGTTIQGIFKIAPAHEAVELESPDIRYYTYHLWVPTISRGSLAAKQTIRVRGHNFYIVDMWEDSDDWIEAVLSRR